MVQTQRWAKTVLGERVIGNLVGSSVEQEVGGAGADGGQIAGETESLDAGSDGGGAREALSSNHCISISFIKRLGNGKFVQ